MLILLSTPESPPKPLCRKAWLLELLAKLELNFQFAVEAAVVEQNEPVRSLDEETSVVGLRINFDFFYELGAIMGTLGAIFFQVGD